MRNKEKVKEYNEKYYQENKERELTRVKKYYQENKEREREKAREYYHRNKEEINKKRSKSFKDGKNRDKINKRRRVYNKNRYNNDPLFKLTSTIRSLISLSIKRSGYSKSSKTTEILGCSFEELKSHIESKFESWMTWENYGKYNGELNYGWDIDHIIPLSSANTEEDIIKLNHYTNLQPLCSFINRDVKIDNLEYIIKNS